MGHAYRRFSSIPATPYSLQPLTLTHLYHQLVFDFGSYFKDFSPLCMCKKWYRWTYLQRRNGDIDVENKVMDRHQQGKEGQDELGDQDWCIYPTKYKTDN